MEAAPGMAGYVRGSRRSISLGIADRTRSRFVRISR
jgi:hypothetical protein